MTFLGQLNEQGEYHGYGKYHWDDNSIYIGFWQNGEFHGKGTYKWPDGDIYVGDWVKGKRTGNGTFQWSNKDIYQGQFYNGKRHGDGTQWHADGNIYQGQWSEGERNGKGLFYIASSKAVYEVNWVNGQAVGYGRFRTANRDLYEGNFLNGKRHGEGTFTWADGSRIHGYWENGVRDDSRVRDLPPKIADWNPPEDFLKSKPLPISHFEATPPIKWDKDPPIKLSTTVGNYADSKIEYDQKAVVKSVSSGPDQFQRLPLHQKQKSENNLNYFNNINNNNSPMNSTATTNDGGGGAGVNGVGSLNFNLSSPTAAVDLHQNHQDQIDSGNKSKSNEGLDNQEQTKKLPERSSKLEKKPSQRAAQVLKKKLTLSHKHSNHHSDKEKDKDKGDGNISGDDKKMKNLNKMVKSLKSNSPFKNKKDLPSGFSSLNFKSHSVHDITDLDDYNPSKALSAQASPLHSHSNNTDSSESSTIKRTSEIEQGTPITPSVIRSSVRKFPFSSNKQENRKATKLENFSIDDLSNPDSIDFIIPDSFQKNSILEDESAPPDQINLDNLNSIPDLKSAFPEDIEDIDLDNLSTYESTRKSFGELAEKEAEIPQAIAVEEKKKVPPPVSLFTSPPVSHRPVLIIPANLTETISNITQKDNLLDDDQFTTQPPKASLRSQLNNNSIARSSNRKGHLTTFFDDLKIDFDFNNL